MKKKILIPGVCLLLLCSIVLGIFMIRPGSSAQSGNATNPTEGLSPDLLGSSDHLVIFYTNGGMSINPRRVAHNTLIGTLPVPYRQGDTFAGWYYDASMTLPAADTDPVTSDICLYASYEDQTGQVAVELNNFTAATKVDPDFVITVLSSDHSMSAEDVKALISAKNLSKPDDKDFIAVVGEAGVYQITGIDGFDEGCTFRITLDDGRLSYLDQTEGVRDFNFTTDMETVANVKLSENLIYIHIDELSEIVNNGQKVTSLSAPLLTLTKDGKTTAADLTEGQFTYRGDQVLREGDTVVIYSGIRPDLCTPETTQKEAGEVAFLQIRFVDGETYTFTNAKTTDVVFRPDILPVNQALDQDFSDTTITIDSHLLDYSEDVYAKFNLNSDTTIDCGDFIVLYTGEFGTANTVVGSYGKITQVETSGENTVLYYERCDWTTVQSAMDLHTQQSVDGEYLLENVDREAIESAVAQQAIDSGFAQEAALYLVTVATATENFTKFSEEMDLTDIRVTLEDGTEADPQTLQLMGNEKKAKVEISKIAVFLSPDPKHFSGENGIRLTLEITVNISFFSGKDANEKIVLAVTGAFEMEYCLAVDVTGYAIVNTDYVIPYIDDYRIAISLDVMNYIGISFDVNVSVQEKKSDGEWVGIGKTDEKIAYIKSVLKGINMAIPTGDVLASDELADKYGTMLAAEPEWVTIFEKDIFRKQFGVPPMLPIVGVELSVEFVVSMDASVAMGLDYYHTSCERQVYTLDLYSMKLANENLPMKEETYEFTAYIMGRVGVRAGIRTSVMLFVVDSEYVSVGFVGEAGLYFKFRGYFYYELHYDEQGQRSSSNYGAMILEVGAYAEVKISANMFQQLLAGEIMLKEKEWVFFYAGQADDVHDFVLKQEDMPEVQLKQHFRTAVLPYDLFNMRYMDLLDGKVKTATYDVKHFTIEISNDAFVFDPVSKIITVNPKPGDVKLEGTMTIKWNLYANTYQQHPPVRTINLYWDNLKDGYVISPETDGGTYVPIIVGAYESKVTVPADPVKQGYVFAGWYTDQAHTQPYSFPATMPNVDTVIYAAWTPATDTQYTVCHYQQVLGSSTYELVQTQVLTGTTESVVSPKPLTYEGFVTPSQRDVVIRPDGSTELHYYYDRIVSVLTFDPGIAEAKTITYVLQYGASVSAPRMAVPGYDFLGYDQMVPTRMGDRSVTYTAQWKKANTKFTVEYYVQQTNGRYALMDKLTGSELLDTVIPVKDLLEKWTFSNGKTAMEAFAQAGSVEFENVTVDGKDLTAAGADLIVQADMVVKVRFRRMSYTATFDPGNGQEPVVLTLYSGSEILPPTGLTRTGYALEGWEPQVPAVMGTQDLNFTAKWSAANYTVSFQANGGTGTMADQGFRYDAAIALTPNTFEKTGYRFAGWSLTAAGQAVYEDAEEVINLAESGTLTLYAVWKPVSYNIYYLNAEEHTNPQTYTIESGGLALSAPKDRVGYTFGGWKDAKGNLVAKIPAGSTGDLQLTAQWNPHTNTPYTVKHLLEDLSGSGYTLAKTQNFTGTTGSTVTPSTLTFEGFTAPRTKTVTIAADGSLVVEYRYNRNVYALTFKFNDGVTADLKLTGKYGTAISVPTIQRQGYGFNGWFAADHQNFTAQTMPACSMILYGSWTANTYSCTVNHYTEDLNGNWVLSHTDSLTGTMDSQLTPAAKQYTGFATPEVQTITIGTGNNTVSYYYIRNCHLLTWNLGGGTVSGEYTSGQVYYGQTIVPPQVTKEGHTGQWDSALVDTMPDQPLTYNMVWTANTYTLTMDFGNGGVTTKKIKYGQPIELPVPVWQGYTFTGWNEKAPDKMPAHDLHFVATWSLNTYTIEYVLGGGTNHTGNPTSYNVTQLPITLKDPVKTGYTFLGWYEGGSRITSLANGKVGNRTLTAQWQANSYQVVFHANDGSGVTKKQTITYGDYINLTGNSFTRSGYTFQGWATTASGGVTYWDKQQVVNLTAQSGGKINLYAVWEMKEYSVSYVGLENVANDSRNPAKYTVMTNEFTLYSPSGAPEGKHFVGWYLDAAYKVSAGNRYTATELNDLTLYAKWDWNTYQIQFDDGLQDSTDVDGVQPNLTSDTPVTLKSYTELGFKNKGYTFGGWKKTPDGIVADYEDQDTVQFTVNQNPGVVKLYAHWVPVTYKVTYNPGDGGASCPEDTNFTIETPNFDLETPTGQPGHRFAGWYDASLNEWTVIPKGTDYNVSLTAHWEHIDYTITLDNQGADVANGTTALYPKYSEGVYSDRNFTGSVAKITVPQRLGYTFLGYYEAVSGNGTVNAVGTNPRIDAEGKILFNSSTYTENFILKALWKPNTYTVIYNANGGSGSMSNSTHTYGVSSNLSANSFTRDKYTFIGWSESATATEAQYAPGAEVTTLASGGSKRLYAVWALNTKATFYGEELYVKSIGDKGHSGDVASVLDVQALADRGYKYKVTIKYNLQVDGDKVDAVTRFVIGGSEIFNTGDVRYGNNASGSPTHTIKDRSASELRNNSYFELWFDAKGISIFDAINRFWIRNCTITFEFYK